MRWRDVWWEMIVFPTHCMSICCFAVVDMVYCIHRAFSLLDLLLGDSTIQSFNLKIKLWSYPGPSLTMLPLRSSQQCSKNKCNFYKGSCPWNMLSLWHVENVVFLTLILSSNMIPSQNEIILHRLPPATLHLIPFFSFCIQILPWSRVPCNLPHL